MCREAFSFDGKSYGTATYGVLLTFDAIDKVLIDTISVVCTLSARLSLRHIEQHDGTLQQSHLLPKKRENKEKKRK